MFASGFLFFIFDFLIKNQVIDKLGNGIVKDLGVFVLRFVPNTQMAFSIPVHKVILLVVTLLILFSLIQLFIYSCRDGLYGHMWALNFVIWAGLANLYDRITRGFVVDYIDFGFFPVFNLADIVIVIGLVTLLILTSRLQNKADLKVLEA